jgi:hypothetical protein
MTRQSLEGGASSLSRLLDHILSHNISVGLLWRNDQPVAENSDNTLHSQETDTHATGGIRTRSANKPAAAPHRRIRPRQHRDPLYYY